jgi:hypothetical protein
MEKLEEARGSEEGEEDEDEDDAWDIKTLKQLVEDGQNMDIKPVEYNEIYKIYKIAIDWLKNAHSLLNQKEIEYDKLLDLKDEAMSDRFEVDLPEISLIQQMLDV